MAFNIYQSLLFVLFVIPIAYIFALEHITVYLALGASLVILTGIFVYIESLREISLAISGLITRCVNSISHIILYGLRLWMACIFFQSGLTKTNMASTFSLFEYEYKVLWVPLPPPIIEKYSLTIESMPIELASYLAVFGELFFPALLLVGIGGRIPAIALFVINYVALVSYPSLWNESFALPFQLHITWGVALLLLVICGSGKLSVDNLIVRKYQGYDY